MATTNLQRQQGPAPDRTDSMELLNASTIDTEDKLASGQNLTEQPPSVKVENFVPENVSQDANNVDASTFNGSRDCNTVNQNMVSAPQAQTVFCGGYDNAAGELEDYSHYINVESIETGSNGVLNENPSLMFHTGYGYSPQIPPYGPYSPVTTPLPSAGGDSHLYSQQFPFPGPYYQQTAHSTPYLTSSTPISQPDLTMPFEGAFLADNSNSNGMLFGPRVDYPLPYSSLGTENFAAISCNPGLYDLRQGFDGFGSGGFWTDWFKSPDGAGSMNPLPSPAASPQPIGTFGSFGQGLGHFSSGVVNASAQFCGVAEMTGPVDFAKSVDYWQQDKWSGQFPVKWHIIKDVSNNLFRHIILSNNDNKPVTNSRDTQEVKLDQGLEMLSIFKKHEADMSILDDFDFYEERQKAMKERKARQQQLQSNSRDPASSVTVDELQFSVVPKSGDVMNQITKTFAQVVQLEQSTTAESHADKSSCSSTPADVAAQPEDLKKPATSEVALSN